MPKDVLKILAVGDQHFTCENVVEVNLFIERLEKLATDQDPDLIVLLGDLLHTHERLHSLVMNTAISFVEKMSNIAETVILVGNHDMCFAPDTEILMWDGTTKKSQDIKVGDKLTGDNSDSNSLREVLATTHGESKMYEIKQDTGVNYTVTENHILSLILTLGDRYDEMDITVKNYLNLPVVIKERLYGFKVDRSTTRIEVVPSSETKFYGWSISGNQKFLLSDFTVVHNCNNQQFLTENHWLNALKPLPNVHVVDKILHKKIKGYKLVFCPYVPPGRFQEALNSSGENWKEADCIFAHQEFYGCKMGAIISVEGDKWPDDFPNVISGHIHQRQTPQKNIYYCGVPFQHAFGDQEKNTIPIMTFKSGKQGYKLEEIDLDLPRKKIVYTDVESMEDYNPIESQDKIKITLNGCIDDFKAFKKTKKYKEIIKTGTKIVFKPKKIKKENQEDNNPVDETSFVTILSALVNREKNSDLYQMYELIVNNKEVFSEDVLFV